MEYNKLYRSNREKMLGGVCGGLGVYFKIDPTLVRLLFVVLTFVGWPMVLLYIIMWLITPLEPARAQAPFPPAAQP